MPLVAQPLALGAVPSPARKPAMRLFRVRTPADRVERIAQQVQASIRGVDGVALRGIAIREIIDGCADRDDTCAVNAVYWWVRSRLRYVEDPDGLDLYPTALEALRIGGEDCDGHTIVGSTILALLGFRTGCKVIHTRAGEWHVYGRVGLPRSAPTRFISYDTTWPKATGPGDELPASQVVRSWEWVFDLRKDR